MVLQKAITFGSRFHSRQLLKQRALFRYFVRGIGGSRLRLKQLLVGYEDRVAKLCRSYRSCCVAEMAADGGDESVLVAAESMYYIHDICDPEDPGVIVSYGIH